MDMQNRVALARYHHKRGLRMLKCAKGVGTCGHREAFHRLAATCFEARDWNMSEAKDLAWLAKDLG